VKNQLGKWKNRSTGKGRATRSKDISEPWGKAIEERKRIKGERAGGRQFSGKVAIAKRPYKFHKKGTQKRSNCDVQKVVI